jgi:hypothetical protein
MLPIEHAYFFTEHFCWHKCSSKAAKNFVGVLRNEIARDELCEESRSGDETEGGQLPLKIRDTTSQTAFLFMQTSMP